MMSRIPCEARYSTEYAINGRLRKGMAALVRSSVSGQSLVPNPAARMNAFIKKQKSEVRGQSLMTND